MRDARNSQQPTSKATLALVLLVVAGCTAHTQAISTPQPTIPLIATSHIQPLPTRTPTASPTATFIPTATATAKATATPTPDPTPTSPPPLVAVDAGHGGIDLGARHFDADGRMDFHESGVNLDIALRVRDLLLARGYRVVMTRDGDYRLFQDQDVNDDGEVTYIDEAQARVDFVNEAGADLLLSIHQNAYERSDSGYVGDVGGTVVYYCADRPFSELSLRFANLVHEQILQAFQDLEHEVRDRGVWDDLILREPGEPGSHIILLGPETERIARSSEMPGVLSETLFITHDREAQLARNPEALDRFALAYANAVDVYFQGSLAK